MNIITQIFIKNIEKTLKIFSEDILSSINTYINRSLRYTNSRISLSDLLSIPNKVVMDSIIKNVILTLEKLDEDYFNSPQRKAQHYPKGTYSRTIITLFGEVTFKRRAYVDKNGKNHFYYLDSLLNISPRVVFDNDVINELLFLAGKHTSYSTIGQILGQYIFKNDFSTDKNKYISRATIANYIKRSDINTFFPLKQNKVKDIFIELDEHYIPIQKPKKSPYPVKKQMIKAAKIYSSRIKNGYSDRFIILDELESVSKFRDRIYEYVYRTYDLDYVENIYILGDGANWIKATRDIFDTTKTHYALDKFHAMQALQRITTYSNMDEYEKAKEFIESDNRAAFKQWIKDFSEKFPDREEIIEEKSKYILNNWAALQRLLKANASCSMEGCISHSLANIFTSRPKGFSKPVLAKRLALRALYLNSFDDKQVFIKLMNSNQTINNFTNLDFSILDDRYKGDTYKVNLNTNFAV